MTKPMHGDEESIAVVVILLYAVVQQTMDSLVVINKVEASWTKMIYKELAEETQDEIRQEEL